MSDLMLHGVLNMPLPDDPTECDHVTWAQFKDRARQASQRIKEMEAELERVKREARNEALREAVKRIDAFLGCGRIGVDEYVKGQDECAVYLRKEILALMEDTDDDD